MEKLTIEVRDGTDFVRIMQSVVPAYQMSWLVSQDKLLILCSVARWNINNLHFCSHWAFHSDVWLSFSWWMYPNCQSCFRIYRCRWATLLLTDRWITIDKYNTELTWLLGFELRKSWNSKVIFYYHETYSNIIMSFLDFQIIFFSFSH